VLRRCREELTLSSIRREGRVLRSSQRLTLSSSGESLMFSSISGEGLAQKLLPSPSDRLPRSIARSIRDRLAQRLLPSTS